jgi:hypothetical protein
MKYVFCDVDVTPERTVEDLAVVQPLSPAACNLV